MVYVHVPFCRSFCTYCDFYSEIACRGKDAQATKDWLRSLLSEISSRRTEIEATSDTNTLYIGGGTPSVLPLDVLRRIVEALGQKRYDEFTVEVNPEDIIEKGPEYLAGLRDLGVNRISVGVQSLDDGILRWMGRRHDAERARNALRMLRDAGFESISADVIFGINGLSLRTLEGTVEELVGMGIQHLSAYQLSIEEGSALAGMIEDGRYTEASDEECRTQYELICDLFRARGFRHYEISNWALPGREAVHNSAYWKRLPYVGLGPGAHSLSIVDGVQRRSWNSQQLSGWTSESETLSPEEIREERLMLGLRTAEGIDGKRIEEKDFFIADSIIRDLI